MSSVENKKIKTYNLIVLDKSGSMGSVQMETISGLNEQIQSMKKAEKDFPEQEQKVCIVYFSSEVEVTECWNKNVSDIKEFTKENYNPDGMTALYDAIGIGVKKLREEIKEELSDRTANVILTIFTDGSENSSRKFDRNEVKKLIGDIKDTGQWTVAFIGCGDNVFDVAESIGISQGNTMSYTAGSVGTQNAFVQMSTARYERSATYSSFASKGMDMADANVTMSFFAKDLDVSGDDKDILDS